MVSATMNVTILICTYNRAGLLGRTLDSLAALDASQGRTWEVLVVDNNSTDGTRACVERRQPTFPVELRYHFEGRQGKSIALNTGFDLARGEIILYTDDDVRVPRGWMEAAVRPLFAQPDLAYTGGPVRPLWESAPPAWLDPGGNMGGTIAVKDHGGTSFIFEEHRKTPLGVNMAVRRELIERIGGFRPDLGRCGKSLLGQEQAEFFYRSRASGARGAYIPDMVVEHHVPAGRLTHRYFRRWWFWKGISHARLHRIHNQTELGLELATVRRVFGVPTFVLRSMLANGIGAMSAVLRGRWRAAASQEMMIWYGIGYVREQMLAAVRPFGSAARGCEPAPADGSSNRLRTPGLSTFVDSHDRPTIEQHHA
jgi:glycosyltransferase involved in cell wall biosynthesis